ncbi:MAG: S8 family peptidase [Anaerolineae bacterium]|nr:S8 family peptidase [Candidatus Roseilinea sp.]MDW8450491.1 S8 family peptidase [Anaerolineae bacterium]
MRRNFYLPALVAAALICSARTPTPVTLAQEDDAAVQRRAAAIAAPHPTGEIILKYKSPEKFRVLDVAATQMAANAAGRDVAPMHVLTADAMRTLSAQAGVALTHVREMSGEAHVLRLPQPLPYDEVERIAKRLEQLDEVEYASPSGWRFIALTPDDSLYGQQWHYFAPAPGNYGANLPAAWDITTGTASIVVSVIDTGILFDHPDLAGRTVPGYDFITNLFVARDGDGRDADASDPGDWSIASDPCGASPSSWHGTHVAGTIGAATNNGTGVAGINWVSKILPVRALGRCGGTDADIIDSMRWSAGLSVPGVPANSNPARVINMSLGGSGSCTSALQNAVNAVIAANSVLVVAAGNENSPAVGFTPGNCNGVITVAATNRNGDKASYSNFGSVVEISAPGGESGSDGVLSTLNAGTTTPAAHNYVFYKGTSMAAPHVAGVVSLMLSVNASLTPAQVLSLLQTTVTPFPSGSTCNISNCGAGIVNAAAAVQAAQGSGGPPPTSGRAYIPIAVKSGASTPPPPPPGGGLVNGDFEQGPGVGWTATSNYPDNCLICDRDNLPDSGPHGGNWAAWFGGVNNENAVLKQTVTVPAGAPHLGFWHVIGSNDYCSDNYDVARIKVNGTEVRKIHLCSTTHTYPNWKKTSVNLSAYAGQSVLLELTVKTDNLIASNWLVDDLAFQTTPSP